MTMLVTAVGASTGPIEDEAGLLSRSGIPPIHRRALSRTQVRALAAAEACLDDAALDDAARQTTGVLVGTCFSNARQRLNARRVEESINRVRAARAQGANPRHAMAAVLEAFGATTQDRIGEMASSIPSRIAIAHGLHGRVASLESAETTTTAALWHARTSLAVGSTTHELVVLAQETPPQDLLDAWARRRGDAGRRTGTQYWEEGAFALAITTPEQAQRVGQPVLAAVLGVGISHTARSGTFRGPRPDGLANTIGALYSDVSTTPAEQVTRLVLPPWEHDLADELHRWFPTANVDLPTGSGTGLAEQELAHLAASPDDTVVVCVETSVTGTVGLTVLGSGAGVPAAEPHRTARRRVEILGMAARFGPGKDLDDFRAATLSATPGLAALEPAVVPAELYEPGPPVTGFSYCATGYALARPVTRPDECVIPPRRWALLDTAQQLALAVAAQALHDTRNALSGRGAVIVGTTLGPSARRGTPVNDELALDAEFASAAAALVANELGLDAVPIAVEAACASSLAALSIAVNGIESGELDYALVGGVELPCNIRDLVLCSALSMLSPTVTRPFSPDADGLTPGDGCGFIVVAADPTGQSPAIRVVSVGASCDATSMLAPAADGQTLAIRRALEAGAVNPAGVDAIEAHGTGTVRGDAAELQALTSCYLRTGRTTPLHVSSVKALVGHTFAAAGLAGLIRTCLALRENILPGTPGAAPPTSAPGIVIPSTPHPWTHRGPQRAAVSSFGTGGINYHVILEKEKS